MAFIIRPDSKENDPIEYPFGACPECGECMGFNLGRQNWMMCEKHKIRWCVGDNIFSHWRMETEKDWNKNWEDYGHFRIIPHSELIEWSNQIGKSEDEKKIIRESNKKMMKDRRHEYFQEMVNSGEYKATSYDESGRITWVESIKGETDLFNETPPRSRMVEWNEIKDETDAT